jgi:hypothetical protein
VHSQEDGLELSAELQAIISEFNDPLGGLLRVAPWWLLWRSMLLTRAAAADPVAFVHDWIQKERVDGVCLFCGGQLEVLGADEGEGKVYWFCAPCTVVGVQLVDALASPAFGRVKRPASLFWLVGIRWLISPRRSASPT